MVNVPSPRKWLNKQIERQVRNTISKVNYPSVGYGRNPRQNQPEPPYEREIHPQWIYQLRQNSTLVNNSIEEKVSQTFRRGFTGWEKEYAAKCSNCKEEFEDLDPFREQLGSFGENLEEEEIDLDSPRVCPHCEELSEIKYPKEEEKDRAEEFFMQCNEKTDIQRHLEPSDQNSVGQTFLEVCKEIAWDIQSFDDGWMLFEREYVTDPESGVILDYNLKEVHRAPPELMRYSMTEDGQFGGEYWVCPECRTTVDNYRAETEPSDCSHCGGYTYEVYAMALEEPGGEPISYFIRGEFCHASEYEPGKYYGYSPILTLWEESRTIEKMDEWYKSAYRERRAPRGAMLIRSSNAESVRSFNKGQMEKLRNDKHYIPTFIDDTEGSGKALEWVNLLEDPAEMQHMEMREWFLERISAKYGVTPVFQQGSPNNSGLSQSLEIVVSNRSADRLRRIFNTTFIPAFLGQLQIDGWDRELRPVEEEDEEAEADVQSKFLQNATRAEEAGFEYEWTEDDRLNIYPGKPDKEEEGEGGKGGAGAPVPDVGPDAGGSPAEAAGGAPGTPGHQDPRIAESDDGGGASVTSDSSGWTNVRYGGSGEEIDVLGHLRDLLEDEEKMYKSSENLSWSDVDISENIRVWIEDPSEAPDQAEIVHDPENAPGDSSAEYYYEEQISTTDLGKIQKINQTAVVVDFFWKPSPAGLIELSKQEGEYTPYEPDEDCDRTYLDAAGLDESDVAEAQIFEGPQGKKFYCSNWRAVGEWAEGEGPFDAEEPIMDREIANEELIEGQELRDYEHVFEFEGFPEVDGGQKILIDPNDNDGWEKFKFVTQEMGGRIIVQDESGENIITQKSDLESKVQGLIGEVHSQKYQGRYELYDPPREIFSPEHVENKEQLGIDEGGINSVFTREVEFDNGERGIYKNYHGNSHEWTLDGEVMAYEISNAITESDTFPETARADLKNGFGSCQMFIEDAETMRESIDGGMIENSDNTVEDVVRNNADRIAEISLVDYMVGNGDRHDDNFMVDEDLNLYAIDNGGHSPPGVDPTDDDMYKIFQYLAKNMTSDDGVDNDEVEDIIEGLFDSVEDQHEEMLEEVQENRDHILEMAESYYGPMSDIAERFRNILEEGDDGNIMLEEMLEDDMEDVRNHIMRRYSYP